MVVGQGDVCWASLADPTGSGPGFDRPVVLLQGDAFNASRLATVVVVPLTSDLRWATGPGNVLLTAKRTGLPRDSVANVTQICRGRLHGSQRTRWPACRHRDRTSADGYRSRPRPQVAASISAGGYYDPSTGQFVVNDPLVDVTNEPYAYARGNPVNETDPAGAAAGIMTSPVLSPWFGPGVGVSQGDQFESVDCEGKPDGTIIIISHPASEETGWERVDVAYECQGGRLIPIDKPRGGPQRRPERGRPERRPARMTVTVVEYRTSRNCNWDGTNWAWAGAGDGWL